MKKNKANSKFSSDLKTNSSPEQTLSEQDLNKVAWFFSLLIDIDQRTKRKHAQRKESSNEPTSSK